MQQDPQEPHRAHALVRAPQNVGEPTSPTGRAMRLLVRDVIREWYVTLPHDRPIRIAILSGSRKNLYLFFSLRDVAAPRPRAHMLSTNGDTSAAPGTRRRRQPHSCVVPQSPGIDTTQSLPLALELHSEA